MAPSLRRFSLGPPPPLLDERAMAPPGVAAEAEVSLVRSGAAWCATVTAHETAAVTAAATLWAGSTSFWFARKFRFSPVFSAFFVDILAHSGHYASRVLRYSQLIVFNSTTRHFSAQHDSMPQILEMVSQLSPFFTGKSGQFQRWPRCGAALQSARSARRKKSSTRVVSKRGLNAQLLLFK